MLKLVSRWAQTPISALAHTNFVTRKELRLVQRLIKRRMPPDMRPPEWGKDTFLRQLPDHCHILDVGCGNNSPYLTKSALPTCHYVGLDVGEYHQTKPNLADRYVLAAPDKFAEAIAGLGQFDAVISSHNLEHCNDREGVLRAMLGAVKPAGLLYLSFPSADSIAFPRRKGTLNYFDDATHKNDPPNFGQVISTMVSGGFDIVFAATKYQPTIRWIIGLYHEHQSAREQALKSDTWPFWGFETVIWARKRQL